VATLDAGRALRGWLVAAAILASPASKLLRSVLLLVGIPTGARRYAQPLYRSGDRRRGCRMSIPAERQFRAGPDIRTTRVGRAAGR